MSIMPSGGNFAKYWGGGASAEGTRFLGGMGECSPRIVIMPITTIKVKLAEYFILRSITTIKVK